jgi:hypothetical protein
MNGDGPAGWPRRPHRPIPLLPSGPGGVFDLASRGADGATIDVASATLTNLKLAERAGFEPAKRGLAAYTLSRRAPSTTRTSLRILKLVAPNPSIQHPPLGIRASPSRGVIRAQPLGHLSGDPCARHPAVLRAANSSAQPPRGQGNPAADPCRPGGAGGRHGRMCRCLISWSAR